MSDDKATWNFADWKAHALYLENAQESALAGWEVTVNELQSHAVLVQSQARLIRDLQADVLALSKNLTASLSLLQSVQAAKLGTAKPGRPSKARESESLLNMVESYKIEYVTANPHTKPSDKNVLVWYFEKAFRDLGMRPQRATAKEFESQLKTMRNRISEARKKRKA